MAEDTLRVIARVKARPGKANELLSLLSTLVEPTRKEPGCISYRLLQNNEDPTDFALIEEWQNSAALQSHFATKHFKDALVKLPNLVAAEPDIQRYHLVS
ncbi:MAG TPA: putative quinol monooxygenase [Thermodesulfobacteriota bacterium]|nr:putative quinol monooxygenase [Thermodesulfobacteriota bacterium]